MSLKDFLSREGRKQRSLTKNCAKAINKKIKTDDRRPALYALLEEVQTAAALEEQAHNDPQNKELQQAWEASKLASETAISHLLGRFSFIYDTNIVVDEEEKTMIYEHLIGHGLRLLPQLRRHLKQAPTLSWGLRMLSEVCDHETMWEVLAEILKDYDAEYERDPTRKLQLMTFLGEFRDPRAVEALIPFLEDHDETVRFVTVEGLFKQRDERAREPLLTLMTKEDEESLRIKNRIAEGFKDTGWNTKGFRGTVEKMLSPEYIVDGKGKIKLKKARELS